LEAMQCNKMAAPGYTQIPMPDKIVVPNFVKEAIDRTGELRFSLATHMARTKIAVTYYKSIRPKQGEGSFKTKGVIGSRYKDQQLIMYCSWGVKNFVSEGIELTAGEVARFLDRLWGEMIQRDKPPITIRRSLHRNLEVRRGHEFLFQSNP
jgi:hypothetical protein